LRSYRYPVGMIRQTRLGKSTSAHVIISALLVLLCCDVPAGDLASGREKATQCAVCHGKDGIGTQPDTPNIAGQKEFYLRAQLLSYRSGKRVHPQMNVIAAGLSDEDIEDLVTWYANMTITVKMPGDDG
jgi:cytochrome c553